MTLFRYKYRRSRPPVFFDCRARFNALFFNCMYLSNLLPILFSLPNGGSVYNLQNYTSDLGIRDCSLISFTVTLSSFILVCSSFSNFYTLTPIVMSFSIHLFFKDVLLTCVLPLHSYIFTAIISSLHFLSKILLDAHSDLVFV